MQTKIIKIQEVKKQQADFAAAGEIIKQGGLVAFPTETVYGLGANGLDAEACAGIYAAKGRPSDNPLILHVANRAMIDDVAAEIPEMAEKLIAAFCPGPITLILRRREIVPLRITGGLDTVGIRMPDHDIARALIKAAGVPVAAPSANLSGRPSPTTAEAVAADMDGRIPLILDGGGCEFGVESTIVDCTGDEAVILRPGAITREMLAEVVGEVRLDPALTPVLPAASAGRPCPGEGAAVDPVFAQAGQAVPKAPGMKYTHYAPKAPLTLLEGKPAYMAAAFRKQIELAQWKGHVVGIIVSSEVARQLRDVLPEELICSYGQQGNLREIAANLYEALRSFDDKPADMLLGEATTDQGLGLAIMNRLHKASGFRSIRIS